MSIRVGEVIAVTGLKVTLRIDEESSKETLFFAGEKYKGVSIREYDNESLSPVFIVVYCDVNDFSALISGYTKFIASQDYTGFIVDSDANRSIESLQNTDHLWLGIERRRRNHREIIFYHLLLNMRP